jgi:prepilin-type N-terminal cleavage/methylation domain-containing protein/prepilin-type processing-associated H-X9-DG protein
MKPRFSNQRNQALTLIEVLVVIAMLAILAVIILPAFDGRASKAPRITCVNNLKQIDLAYRVWPRFQSDKYPMQVSIKQGGAMELVATGNVAANFLVMSNELSTPKILICPADTSRFAATNFTAGFDNSNVSYFVGVDAAEEFPQRIISGDDNFEIGGVPIKSGLLELPTNMPIAWTAARHKFAGNIGLADGSVREVSISELTNLFNQTGLATNRLAIP